MGISMDMVVQYAFLAVKVLAIIVVGWLLAISGRKITEKLTGSIEIFRKQEGLPQSAGKLTYYFVILATTVAVLEAVGLKYVTEPFIDLLNKVAAYLPNLVGAVLILIIGTFFAKISKEFTSSFLETFGVKELGKKYGIENLGEVGGNIVYLLTILFVVIAALNTLEIEAVTKPAVSMLTIILDAIPRIVAAVVVFGIIFFIGRIVSEIAIKIVNELNVDKFAKEIGISSNKFKFDELVNYLIMTFAVLFGLDQAFHYLSAEALYQLTHQLIVVAFKIVVAALIIFAGTYFGSTFEKRTENKTIGKGIKYASITTSVFIALPYLGVSPEVVEVIVFSISIGIGLAFAIAFGLGGKKVAEDVLEKLLNNKNE